MGQSLRRFHAVYIPEFPNKVFKRKKGKSCEIFNGSGFDFEELEGVIPQKPRSIEELERLTKFSRRELKIMYRAFKQECPNGILNEDRFLKIYNPFFPQGDSENYSKHVYRTISKRCEGQITFDKLVTELSLLMHGNLSERLEWTFDLYDIGENGCVTQQDFLDIVTSIYSLLGERVLPSVTKGAVLEHANTVFQELDRDNDGEFNVDDFKSHYLQDPLFENNIQMLTTML